MQTCHSHKHHENDDHGPAPFVFDIHYATEANQNFRTTLWTGQHMQVTVMCIPAKGDIGLELHAEVDQFICVESGHAKVYMGCCQNAMREAGCVKEHDAVIIPAGTWHNIVNIGSCPLKVYSVYAPPQHPHGTLHKTKADAER